MSRAKLPCANLATSHRLSAVLTRTQGGVAYCEAESGVMKGELKPILRPITDAIEPREQLRQ
eukprot:1607069-Amphidinium_carterae.1